ncbi:hypothetical protein [Bradyrhizobium sp. SK17]|uniref:hypothetical protein n=1 Tax=Bradyrhizobium sp. SK17 TaxID=2057741 RepID=UPI0012FD7AB2|nr:hypothetical protein [Bradyrhizobium sp. SK17]
MRKLILITAMVLASAAAQAGERSLSLGGAASLPAATSNSVNMAGKVADAPAPQPQVQPAAQQAPVQQANVQPSAAPDTGQQLEQRAVAHRSSHRRHARRWTEGRIIGELHRHGIYW